MKPRHLANALPILIASFISACSVQKKSTPDININGYLNDNCYQAIFVFDPDESAGGLVAKRESSYLKAKRADLMHLTLEKLTSASLASSLAHITDTYAREMLFDKMKGNAVNKLKSFVESGTVAFVYYNEKNSIIIGYQLSKPGLKERVDMLISLLKKDSGYDKKGQE